MEKRAKILCTFRFVPHIFTINLFFMKSWHYFLLQLFIFFILFPGKPVRSQLFEIGHTSYTWFDSTRNDRPIPVEVYYPALTTGEEVPVAPGQFPVLSLGHGFVMNVGSYTNFSDFLVPQGYIFVLSNTETGFSSSHQDFGLDLSFILHALELENNDPGSLFFGTISGTNAVMGHSMGGGASMLAAAGDTIVKAVVNFAAANTTPSAISAATNITVPALLFSGSGDCVTPPAQHQEPMYDSLASSCKTRIEVTGGGHCYFANDNFLCTFGENSCGPNITITREEQHDITFDFLLPWLDHFLKGEQEAWEIFSDSLAYSNRIAYEQDCKLTGICGKETGILNLKGFPVPFHDYFTFTGNMELKHLWIFDISGRLVFEGPLKGTMPLTINTSDLQSGFYQFRFTGISGKEIMVKGCKF
jgi:pimeloyl-ACP methyl ester carboxylesterase